MSSSGLMDRDIGRFYPFRHRAPRMGRGNPIPRGDSVNVFRRHAAKRMAPATALLVAGAGLSAAGLYAGSAAAAPATPVVKIVTPVTTQTVERGKGEPVYL